MAHTIPSCNPNPCTGGTAPENGGIGNCGTALPHRGNCQYTCNTGYTPNGIMSCHLGTMTAGTCVENYCMSPPPTNGKKGTCEPSLASGKTCQPVCNAGYDIQGHHSCNLGILAPARCTPKPCPTSAPANGANGNCAAIIIHAATCVPTCNNGYYRSGITSCRLGTLTKARCPPKPCTNIRPPANAAMGSCSQTISSGATCRPSCNTGYTLRGVTRCNLGVVTYPSCSPNPCDTRSIVDRNGGRGDCPTTSMSHGGRCETTCNSGYVVSGPATCSLGRLTVPRCIGQPCSIPNLARGNRGSCSATLNHGASCTPGCASGYTLSGRWSCSAQRIVSTPSCTPTPCAIPGTRGALGTTCAAPGQGARAIPNALTHGQTCIPTCQPTNTKSNNGAGWKCNLGRLTGVTCQDKPCVRPERTYPHGYRRTPFCLACYQRFIGGRMFDGCTSVTQYRTCNYGSFAGGACGAWTRGLLIALIDDPHVMDADSDDLNSDSNSDSDSDLDSDTPDPASSSRNVSLMSLSLKDDTSSSGNENSHPTMSGVSWLLHASEQKIQGDFFAPDAMASTMVGFSVGGGFIHNHILKIYPKANFPCWEIHWDGEVKTPESDDKSFLFNQNEKEGQVLVEFPTAATLKLTLPSGISYTGRRHYQSRRRIPAALAWMDGEFDGPLGDNSTGSLVDSSQSLVPAAERLMESLYDQVSMEDLHTRFASLQQVATASNQEEHQIPSTQELKASLKDSANLGGRELAYNCQLDDVRLAAAVNTCNEWVDPGESELTKFLFISCVEGVCAFGTEEGEVFAYVEAQMRAKEDDGKLPQFTLSGSGTGYKCPVGEEDGFAFQPVQEWTDAYTKEVARLRETFKQIIGDAWRTAELCEPDRHTYTTSTQTGAVEARTTFKCQTFLKQMAMPRTSKDMQTLRSSLDSDLTEKLYIGGYYHQGKWRWDDSGEITTSQWPEMAPPTGANVFLCFNRVAAKIEACADGSLNAICQDAFIETSSEDVKALVKILGDLRTPAATE
eukprot:TRINITY_DN10805_c0_g1_i1.p1 TRINITY_DN10805_c0_g1~~TRINITY_DN10805_c0_g1_i1.p1  ORF type:complete len:1024 (+),score=100.54 TRINITY_DN10805_c0_g1_i1:35-3073(+)